MRHTETLAARALIASLTRNHTEVHQLLLDSLSHPPELTPNKPATAPQKRGRQVRHRTGLKKLGSPAQAHHMGAALWRLTPEFVRPTFLTLVAQAVEQVPAPSR